MITPNSTMVMKLNGWRELGEEMERIVSFMSKEQRSDLLPDWFMDRLLRLLCEK